MMQSKQCNCADAAKRTGEIERLPRWSAKLAHRLAQLGHGVHVIVVVADNDGEPQWSVQSSTRLENQG